MTPFTREDSEKVATQLGTDFESIASDPSGSRPDEEAEVEAYLRYTSPEYPAFQEWEIHRAISKVKSHSAPGSDLLTILVIKHVWDWGEFRPTIIAVLNNGLKNYPESWKHAIIAPIPKPTGGYRPISLLSQMGKVVEIIVTWRLDSTLPIAHRQYGCRSGVSVKAVLYQFAHSAMAPGHTMHCFSTYPRLTTE